MAQTSEDYLKQKEQIRLSKLCLEISEALNAGEQIYSMLTACTDALVSHLGAAFARIWTLNETEQLLEMQASSGMYTHLNGAHARVPMGALKIGYIAASRMPHLTNEVIGDMRVADQEWAKREGMVAFAGYPLLIQDRLIGVMALFSRQHLSDATLQAMATVSNGIALGIERLKMREERLSLLQRERTARAELELSHQRLRALFMQTPANICILQGKEHIIVFANPGYLQLIGQRNDIIGKTVRAALPEIKYERIFTLLDHVYTTGETYTANAVKIPLDRTYTGITEEAFFNFVYQPSFDKQGAIDGVLVHSVEVTEQVKEREEVQRGRERLQMAQRVGHIGTFEWDIANNLVRWTPELEALFGLPPGAFEGKYENWAQRLHPDDLQAATETLTQAIKKIIPYDAEFRIIRPDKQIRWLLAKGEVTQYDEQGQPRFMIGVNIDITERKKTEQELTRLSENLQDLNSHLETKIEERTAVLHLLNTELQRSNQELQDFAYVASHDLQEPLRKIQAFGNLLEEEHGDVLGDGHAYLERMRNAAGRMRVLIDDLLVFSRVTTKAQPFVSVDLNAIVSQVIDDLETRLQETQGTIKVDHLPSIEADAQQMYQVLQNLLGNALKFHKPSTPPHVHVFATLQPNPENASQQQCVLSVQDNGIGFDEKYLDRIFTVFQRLHGRGTYEGTGVGLAVVRKIVERHGGEVTAKSTLGTGTTFIVTLPTNH